MRAKTAILLVLACLVLTADGARADYPGSAIGGPAGSAPQVAMVLSRQVALADGLVVLGSKSISSSDLAGAKCSVTGFTSDGTSTTVTILWYNLTTSTTMDTRTISSATTAESTGSRVTLTSGTNVYEIRASITSGVGTATIYWAGLQQ